MGLTSVELWKRITEVGLASPDVCRRWAIEIAGRLDAEAATDGNRVLKELQRSGFVTDFQAQRLNQLHAQPLQFRQWIFQRPLTGIWEGWFEVRPSTDQQDSQQSNCLLRKVSKVDLEQIRSCAPSLERLQQFVSLAPTPELQRWRGGEAIDGVLAVEGDVCPGKLLSDVSTGGAMQHEQATEIIAKVAQALSKLHDSGIAHGRVLPDRVYVTASGQVTLAVDPLCQHTAAPNQIETGIVGPNLNGLVAEQFVAPDFLAPGQLPTPASDIYSLGSVWWWLLTGEPPARQKEAQAAMAAHADRLPQFPQQLLPAGLEQCMRHALARNLDARFQNASQFSAAIDCARQAHAAVNPPADEVLPEPPTGLEKVRDEPQVHKRKESPRGRTQQSQGALPSKRKKVASGKSKSPVKHSTQATAATESKPSKTVLAPQAAGDQLQSDAQQDSVRKVATAASEKPSTRSTLVAPAKQPASPPADDARSVGRPGRTKKKNALLLPGIAGCGILILGLIVLKLTGVFERDVASDPKPTVTTAPYVPPAKPGTAALTDGDPRGQYYQIVTDRQLLWVPPFLPEPIPITLLPPGAQLLVSLRPSSMEANVGMNAALEALEDELDPLLAQIESLCDEDLYKCSQITLAFYPPAESGAPPQSVARVELAEALPVADFRKDKPDWTEAMLGGQRLLTNEDTAIYFDSSANEADAQLRTFSVGPLALIKEAAELGGAAGPMVPQMERLWKASSTSADLCLLAAPAFLFTEGRWIVEQMPMRLQALLRSLIGNQMRGAMLQLRFTDRWYAELQLVAGSDRDAGAIATKLSEAASALPSQVENWFVSEVPHSHWRRLAMRYPRMLEVWHEYSRFGVERGTAIANSYLPLEAAPNLLVATWIALQDGATQLEQTAGPSTPVETALTLEEYLNRPIRVRFEQEPIEVALQLVGEEANRQLPQGTPPARFLLDGDAFELAGITRNQQLSDFRYDSTPLRTVLTEIAKLGNPDRTVTDTREDNQQLIWVAADDPRSPGNPLILLTTRAAAKAAGYQLPAEFTPAP